MRTKNNKGIPSSLISSIIVIGIILMFVGITINFKLKSSGKIALKEHNLETTDTEELKLNLEITKGESVLANGWYNSEEVEVTLTLISNIEEEKIVEHNIVYGTKLKESKELPNNLKRLERKIQKIIVQDEGITEVIAYVDMGNGIKSNMQTIEVKIDRTPPDIGGLTYARLEKNKIKAIANNVKDDGSGIEEFIFLSDYNTSRNNIIVSKENIVESPISEDTHLIQVVTYDKAGNQAYSATDVEDMKQTEYIDYSVYAANNNWQNTPWCWQPLQVICVNIPIRNLTNLMTWKSYYVTCTGGVNQLCYTMNNNLYIYQLTPGQSFSIEPNQILGDIPEDFSPGTRFAGCNWVTLTLCEWLTNNFLVGNSLYRSAKVNVTEVITSRPYASWELHGEPLWSFTANQNLRTRFTSFRWMSCNTKLYKKIKLFSL